MDMTKSVDDPVLFRPRKPTSELITTKNQNKTKTSSQTQTKPEEGFND